MKINELMNYISTQKMKKQETYVQLLNTATIVKSKEVIGGSEEIMTPYAATDFNKALEDYEKAAENLKRANVALMQANSITMIAGGYTIQTAIAAIKSMRDKMMDLQTIVDKKPSKKRKCEGNGTSYFQIVELNFETAAIQKEIDTLKEEITRLENAIAQANAMTEVEVEFIV